ncbi:MAG: choice-of-anchor D domain-containing protein [Bacteroidota bacterium]
MLKYNIFSFLILFSYIFYAQTTTIAKQSFESSGDTWQATFSTTPCTSGVDSWNYRSSLGDITPNDGVQFWGIRDLNGDCGGTDFETISLTNVDISSYNNVSLTFDYYVFEYDNGDDIKYELFFNDQAQGEVIIFDGNSNLSTNGWLTKSIIIPNYVSNIKLNISVKQNGDNDYAGFDNVLLSGSLITPCSELMITEYVEGSSNNKFIEIYNPTDQELNLDEYNLTKFTGKNEEPTGSLALTGTISAFGTYLVENQNENLNIEADLSTGSIMNFNGDDKVALRKDDMIIDIIGVIGDSIEFAKDITLRRKSHIQNPNNQYDLNEWDVYGLDDVSNLNSHISNCMGPIPEIEVSGNLISIADGSTNTKASNNTYFGKINSNSGESISKEFFIKNTGNATLDILNIEISGNDSSDFTLTGNTSFNIIPNDSLAIEVNFISTSKGLKNTTIKIENNDASENPFNFVINAEVTGASNSPIMITQYYEGEGNNKWLEITNISNETIPETYYLALFRNEKAENPIGETPSNNTLIPELTPKQTIKYCSTLIDENIIYAQDGNEIKNPICNFNGNDIIIISTDNDENCWTNKVDIIGNSNYWGENISFVRKYGCENSVPSTGFNFDDWFEYEISEINSATTGYNLRIGEHFVGNTNFENEIWDNGLPDTHRNIEINDNYDTQIKGSFEACNLIINSGISLGINTNDFIGIANNLTVNGTLEVHHEGSLVMVDNSGSVNNNGIINIHKTTTSLKRFDYTYWSSPIKNAILENVFAASSQNSFYQFITSEFNDNNKDENDDDEPAAWQKTSGLMTLGKGYTAMAPDTEPFVDHQSVTFSGEVNNGIINFPIQLSSKDSIDTNDWNLLGNPYPSAIDANLFLNDTVNKTIIGGTIYFWTHNTAQEDGKYTSDDYASFVVGTGGIRANSSGQMPTSNIASCQGFFVEALKEGEIHYTNQMRVKTQNNNFFKSNYFKDNSSKQNDKIWLNLFNDEGAFSQILIGFIKGANKSIEREYDAIRLNGNNYISFYSIVQDKKLAILGTNPFTGNEDINLGFTSNIEEPIKLKIAIDKIEGDINSKEIFIYDKLLNITHDLKITPYEFDISLKGSFDDRFILKLNNGIINDDEIFINSDQLIIKNTSELFEITTSNQKIIHSIKVYDMLGRSIIDKYSKKSTEKISKRELPKPGVYIILAKIENDVYLTKKLILM